MFTKKTLTVVLFTAFVAVGAFSLYVDISSGSFGADSAYAAFFGLDCQADGGCGGGSTGGAVVPADTTSIDSTIDLSGYTFDICADPIFAASFPLSCPGSPTTPVTYPTCHLEISKTADKETVAPNELVTYTISFKNNGGTICTGSGVWLQDKLNPFLNFVSETHTSNMTGGYDVSLPTLNTDTEPHVELNPYNAITRNVEWNS